MRTPHSWPADTSLRSGRLWARTDGVRSCEDETRADDAVVCVSCASRMTARRTHRPPRHLMSTTTPQMLGNPRRNSNRRTVPNLYGTALFDLHKLLCSGRKLTPSDCVRFSKCPVDISVRRKKSTAAARVDLPFDAGQRATVVDRAVGWGA